VTTSDSNEEVCEIFRVRVPCRRELSYLEGETVHATGAQLVSAVGNLHTNLLASQESSTTEA